MRSITFELCAENSNACIAARDGGAHRIELCSNLDVGGLTPPSQLVREAVATGLPIHAMIRPRPGNFAYSAAEFETMCDDLLQLKNLNIAGAVFGILHPDATVDIERTRTLVQLARPLQTTFHRAFDETPSPPEALEAVITTGCDRILTSGGHPDVLTGAASIAALVFQAKGRIAVAAGGGLRPSNAAVVAQLTKTTRFHGSLRGDTIRPHFVQAEDVRTMIQQLRTAI